jgi:hypothetical protein
MIDADPTPQTTQLRTPAETKSAEFEVVREGEPGRPLFLTARRFIRICRLIEQGESASEACRLELVTYRSFRRHVKLNPKYQRRLKQAEEVREEFLLEYHIANVRKHAPRNLLASLWWLERTAPNRFALKTVHRNLNSTEAPIGDHVPESRLLEYSRQMAELAQANEQKRGAENTLLQSNNPSE